MKSYVYKNKSDVIEYLVSQDPLLINLFQLKDEIRVNINERYFESLVDIMIAQQLSSKVSSVISKRIYDYYQGEITAIKVFETKDEELRKLGLSHQKITYLKSLADSVIQGVITFLDMDKKSDQEITSMLIKVKGIGIWSAQMFLIFSLGREDVFSVLDLGLRNALKRVYQNQELMMDEINNISQKWVPYRSIVSHYLWHAWDNE